MIALNVISEGTNKKKKQLERMLKSAAPFVNGIYLTFTKSEESKKYFEEKFKAKVSFFEWCDDFSKSRNFALSQVPENFEYILWLDTDDILVNGSHLKDLKSFDAFFMDYNYNIDKKTGEVLIKHPRERVVRRGAFEWKGQLHETLIPNKKVRNVQVKNIWVDHYPEEEDIKEGEVRNARILEKAFKDEKGRDPRTIYYLARTYYDLERYEECRELLKRYLTMSGWDEERAMAWNYLGEISLKEMKPDDAVLNYLMAIKERPEFPLFYINIGVAYSLAKDFDKALHYTKVALRMDEYKTAMVLLPRDEKVKALETIYHCCIAKNKFKEALGAINQMLTFFPNDKMFNDRKKFIEETLELTEMGKQVGNMLKEVDDDKKAALLYALPERLAETQFAEKLRQQFLPPINWPENSIVYFCGRGFEKWSPENLKQGIGGSETAVIQLSKEWVKQGYNVVVYGDPQEEGVYDGVQYLSYWRFNPKDTFDTFIVWRNETLLDFDIKARKVFLDLHDVPEAGEYTKERLKRVDKIFVKSPYHRSLLPDVPDEKFVIIPNGIDLTTLPKEIKKEGVKVVYASSYDRGLEKVLEIGWPIIKKAVPEAELHIFYGWNLFESLNKHNPERMAWKKKMDKLMEQPGVFHHGRVSQQDLIAFKAKSLVHYYPTTFEEIDCISVRESAAVGCIPITTDYAALSGKRYCETYIGNPLEKSTQEDIADAVVSELKEPSGTVTLEADFINPAREENWPHISHLWTNQM